MPETLAYWTEEELESQQNHKPKTFVWLPDLAPLTPLRHLAAGRYDHEDNMTRDDDFPR